MASCSSNTIQPLTPDGYRPVCAAGNGSDTDFTIDFDYIGKEDFSGSTLNQTIRVFKYNVDTGIRNEVTSSASQIDSTTVSLDTAPSSNELVWIYRDSTPVQINFAANDVLSAQLMNKFRRKMLFLYEENNANIASNFDINQGEGGFINQAFTFDGDGSATDFQLNSINVDIPPEAIWVHVDGVYKHPTNDYDTNLSGGTLQLEFVIAPPDGSKIIAIPVEANVISPTIPDDSIGSDELEDNSVGLDQLDLDGVGTDKQVAGWTGSPPSTFGANTIDHSWISDFDSEVTNKRLDQFANPTSDINMNSNKITNLSDGTADSDAATVGQLPSSSIDLANTAIFDSEMSVEFTWTDQSNLPITIASSLNNGTYDFTIKMSWITTDGGESPIIIKMTVNGTEHKWEQYGSRFGGLPPTPVTQTVSWRMQETTNDNKITIDSVEIENGLGQTEAFEAEIAGGTGFLIQPA